MEKNQSENQKLPEEEGKAGGDTANAPVVVQKAEVDNADKAGVKQDREERKEEEEKNDEEEEGEEEKKLEETESVPESPVSLEKVSEDIDQFLLSPALPLPQGEDGNTADHVECGRFVEIFLDLADVMIADYEVGNTKLWQAPEKDSCFLEATHRISSLNETLRKLQLAESQVSLINRTGRIQQRAMAYLEEEFRLLLEESKTNDADHCPIDSKGKHEQDHSVSPEDEIVFQGYSDDVVSCMNKIAKEMIYGGFESECCQVYTISRRNAFEEIFHKLEFEKHSIDDVHKMHWDALEREIITWIKTFKQCATVCFSSERKFAESVFSDNPAISSGLFSNLTRGVVIQLLNFAEGIAMTKRSAEKLFKILDMYETLRDMVPKMDGLFTDEGANELKAEIMTARSRLGEGAICIFCDLENSIKADSGKTPVPGGAVHPLTRYIMNYLKYACEYKDTLEQVFREHSKIEREDSTSRQRFDQQQASGNNENESDDQNRAQSPFSVQLMRMMELLDSNLEVKSKLYREVALSSIFMMNNGRYILQKIKGSAEINSSMGETWYRKRSSDLRQYHKNYQRETWVRLLGCLSLEGLNVNGKVVKPVLKERFKSFNTMFEEIHKTQSSWIVSDEQLQSELRVSISAVVIPAYRSFYGRFSQYLDPGRQTEKYIKFQPDDIENYIEELFDGNAAPSTTRRKP